MPEPVAFYPLNARYKAAEKENRQTEGILRDVALTNGPYNQPGGAYMFYGTASSYIEFPNIGGLDTRFSITLMCWVQPGGRDGPLFFYFSAISFREGVEMSIVESKLFNRIVQRVGLKRISIPKGIITAEVLTTGKWVHVAASYDHNTGNNSLYINGQLSVTQNIGKGYEIETDPQNVRMGTIGDNSFKGKIAEMKVYDVALNEAQIQSAIGQGSCKTICTFPIPSPVIP